jgi:hypothetical protein
MLMWSTNLTSGWLQFGLVNQITVSETDQNLPVGSSWQWNLPNYPPGPPINQAEYFNDFMVNPLSTIQVPTLQAPYTPTRAVYEAVVYQANDPLVHYLTSDLNYYDPGTMGLQLTDDVINRPVTNPQQDTKSKRYQPWGLNPQMAIFTYLDTNAFNVSYKDPLIWGSDNWNFPTNLLPGLVGLGQVHRGTPWQTVDLKSTNILLYSVNNGNNGPINAGTNTWAVLTGDMLTDNYGQYHDAALMAPVSDWRLAGLLMSLLNTNAATQLFSVNDPNMADWQNVFNGLTVYSNTAIAIPNTAPIFETDVMTSNSPQATIVADGIATVKAGMTPNQTFNSIGDILAAPELSLNSPWLNTSSVNQLKYGITDTEYEAIPAQLLPLLRPDSIGTLTATNGGWNLRFTGADGFNYAVQSSPDLANWTNVSTNAPTQGGFTVPIPGTSGSPNFFYRSVLLP